MSPTRPAAPGRSGERPGSSSGGGGRTIIDPTAGAAAAAAAAAGTSFPPALVEWFSALQLSDAKLTEVLEFLCGDDMGLTEVDELQELEDEHMATMNSKLPFAKRKKFAANLEALRSTASSASGAAAAASASAEAAPTRRVFETGSWKIIPSSYVLSLSGDEPLAECRTLAAAGILQTLYGTEEELLRAETFNKYFIISHRWEDPEGKHPDPDCTKLKELQKELRKRPEIEGVWMDFPCLPQDKRSGGSHDKTEEEKAFFDNCLQNVNLLYLHGNVLVFLDKEYNTRFWTQYEFFLCSHKATPQGLVPKTKAEFEMRVTIVSIGAAAFSKGKDAEALIATWSERTAAQAVEILGKADVKVTNKKDKEKLLPLLLKFEAALKAKKAIVPFWVEVAKEKGAAAAAAVGGGGSGGGSSGGGQRRGRSARGRGREDDHCENENSIPVHRTRQRGRQGPREGDCEVPGGLCGPCLQWGLGGWQAAWQGHLHVGGRRCGCKTVQHGQGHR